MTLEQFRHRMLSAAEESAQLAQTYRRRYRYLALLIFFAATACAFISLALFFGAHWIGAAILATFAGLLTISGIRDWCEGNDPFRNFMRLRQAILTDYQEEVRIANELGFFSDL